VRSSDMVQVSTGKDRGNGSSMYILHSKGGSAISTDRTTKGDGEGHFPKEIRGKAASRNPAGLGIGLGPGLSKQL